MDRYNAPRKRGANMGYADRKLIGLGFVANATVPPPKLD